MKTKSVIETDPAKVREICLNQPKVSHEEMVASILAQNGKLPPSKPAASPADSVETAWAVLKAEGYPKQDNDPASGETFPVFPETVMQDEEHPLYHNLPENARPETWRELDSAAYNPSKARAI